MRIPKATALVVTAAGVFAGCGAEAADAPVALPSSGTAYRALNDSGRHAVAASCRDRAAARTDGVAADELGRVDAHALRASSLTRRSGWSPSDIAQSPSCAPSGCRS